MVNHSTFQDLSDDWNAIFDNFAKEVYAAKGKGKRISRELYNKTASQFSEALMQGVGKKSFAFDAPTNILKAKLESNLYAFSAAKSLSQHEAMAAALTDANGKLRTFNMFRAEVEKINPLFNERYLKAEYGNAVAQTEAAIEWEEIWSNRHVNGWLVYQTMEDDKVRPEHAAMNLIKLPVEHPFWLTYFPPNGWGPCRCKGLPTDDSRGITKDYDAFKASEKAKVPALFKNNPGTSKIIYNDGHPYYEYVKNSKLKTSTLDAEKNYGMSNWNKIRRDAKDYGLATPAPQTKEQFYDWWANMVKTNGVAGDGFSLKDVKGNSILLDADSNMKSKGFTREHLFKNGHSDYGHLVPDILKNPDEAWSYYDVGLPDKPLSLSYLKYYEDKVFTVFVREEKGALRVVTSYEVTDVNAFKNMRKGVLLHANKKF